MAGRMHAGVSASSGWVACFGNAFTCYALMSRSARLGNNTHSTFVRRSQVPDARTSRRNFPPELSTTGRVCVCVSRLRRKRLHVLFIPQRLAVIENVKWIIYHHQVRTCSNRWHSHVEHNNTLSPYKLAPDPTRRPSICECNGQHSNENGIAPNTHTRQLICAKRPSVWVML